MIDWNKKQRCKKCNDERGIRYCLRTNKDYGWSCCNTLRTDGKCPDACPYAPVKNDQPSALPKLKADSKTELIDFVDKYLPLWMHKPVEQLDNRKPEELMQTDGGKTQLTNWLSAFSYPNREILHKINTRLGIGIPIPEVTESDIETLTAQYLDTLITQDWEALSELHTLYSDYNTPAHIKRVTQYLSSHPLLKKVTRYSIINAGVSEDRSQAFVFCELNGRENWTMVYARHQDKWQIYQLIHGSVQDYFNQKNLFKDMAVAISQDNETLAWEKLKEIDALFVLNADVEYYRGMYFVMAKKTDAAREAWQDAVAFDPTWTPALFNLALLDMQAKDYFSAMDKLTQILKLKPDDTNTLNNVGVCYLALNQPEKAEAYWQRVLAIEANNDYAKKNLEHLHKPS